MGVVIKISLSVPKIIDSAVVPDVLQMKGNENLRNERGMIGNQKVYHPASPSSNKLQQSMTSTTLK